MLLQNNYPHTNIPIWGYFTIQLVYLLNRFINIVPLQMNALMRNYLSVWFLAKVKAFMNSTVAILR